MAHGPIEPPSEQRIGHIVRVAYRFAPPKDSKSKGSDAWKTNRQNGKERPCVVVGTVGDAFYVVAPISSKPSGNDVKLTPAHIQAAKLHPEDGSLIERGEYNLVHMDSLAFTPHRRTGTFFHGILQSGAIRSIRDDFMRAWAEKNLVARVAPADPARAADRARAVNPASTRNTPTALIHGAANSRRDQIHTRITARAEEMIKRENTLPSGSHAHREGPQGPSGSRRPTLNLAKRQDPPDQR